MASTVHPLSSSGFGSASRTPPEGAGMGLLYVAVVLLTVLAATGALVVRYRRVNP